MVDLFQYDDDDGMHLEERVSIKDWLWTAAAKLGECIFG